MHEEGTPPWPTSDVFVKPRPTEILREKVAICIWRESNKTKMTPIGRSVDQLRHTSITFPPEWTRCVSPSSHSCSLAIRSSDPTSPGGGLISISHEQFTMACISSNSGINGQTKAWGNILHGSRKCHLKSERLNESVRIMENIQYSYANHCALKPWWKRADAWQLSKSF